MIRDFGAILKQWTIVAPFAVRSLHPPCMEIPISKAQGCARA